MKAFVLLATGFEEMEAIGIIDILRRGDIDTTIISVTGDKIVTGVHDIPVIADELFENIACWNCDALVLPGGGPGSVLMKEHEGVASAILEVYGNQQLVAAICAAPRVFGKLGLLEGRKATCYPGIEPELINAIVVNEPAVTDGNIITGRGPGYVIDFGLSILKYLGADDAQVASDVSPQ